MFLQHINIVSGEANDLFLTPFGQAASDAGLSASQACFFGKLLEYTSLHGFDLLSDDSMCLFVADYSL